MKKLILIDGNAILHRAFHAMPPFKTSDGQLVNAVYGFASMLLNIFNLEKPDYLAVSFDTKAKTFRHTEYKEYKATRVKAPDEFYAQIPFVYELLEKFKIPVFTFDGFEADDVLATLALQAEKTDDLKTFIVTGDMDMSQVVNDKTNLLVPVKGFSDSIVYDTAKVQEKFGLNPSQIPDMKGLQGDNSDNIKGVPGIGPKTAKDLLQKYGSIENIYQNLEELKGATKEKLSVSKPDAILSKRLATLVRDLDLNLDLKKCEIKNYDMEEVEKFFEKLEFQSLIKKLFALKNRVSKIRDTQAQGDLKKPQNIQQSLF